MQSLQHQNRSHQKVSTYDLQKMLQRAGQPDRFPQIQMRSKEHRESTRLKCVRGPWRPATNETTTQWEARSRPRTPTLYTELNFLRLYPNWTLVVVWHSFLIRYEYVVLSLLLYIVFSNSNFFNYLRATIPYF